MGFVMNVEIQKSDIKIVEEFASADFREVKRCIFFYKTMQNKRRSRFSFVIFESVKQPFFREISEFAINAVPLPEIANSHDS